MNREFLQLAHTLSDKSKIGGWFVSEKLDGTRCFWDGGVSRGQETRDVPWASVIDPKTGKFKKKIKPHATGLWSRYGNPIMAPDWFLDSLPPVPLDGELWAGRGNFQLCRSICGGDTPDPRFELIKYAVYGCPPIDLVIQDGEVKNTNFYCQFSLKKMASYVFRHSKYVPNWRTLDDDSPFEHELLSLIDTLGEGPAYVHPQIKLPDDEQAAREAVEAELAKVIERGGEGVIIRDPRAVWTPKRTRSVLKYKPFQDDEGTLVGFTSGRLTDKGSKHAGKIGALILDYNGKRLELSGLTDEERLFKTFDMEEHARRHPGADMPDWFEATHFKVGERITFVFRELTDDGIPREARYLRKRDEE